MRITRMARGVISVLMVAAIAEACAGTAALTLWPASAAPTAPSVPTAQVATPTPYCGHAQLSVDYGNYVLAGIVVPGPLHDLFATTDDAAAGATIVVARVTAKGNAVWNTRDGSIPPALLPGPGRMNVPNALVLTPYEVQIEQVVRGRATVGSSQVTVEGGTVGCYEMSVDPIPSISTGGEYLLFLRAQQFADGAEGYPLMKIFEAWTTNGETVGTPEGSRKLADIVATIRALPTPTASPRSTPSA